MKARTLITILIVAITAVLLYYIFVKPQTFMRPVPGVITSPFGHRSSPKEGASTDHLGTDFSAPTGTPIKSPYDGKILRIFDGGTGGNQLQVVHAKGWITGYAHLSSYNKKVGDKVKRGDVIAFTGATGNVTGAHLHFTLTNPQGTKVDPELYFNKKLA